MAPFSMFCFLPTELKLSIWEFACDEPRLIILTNPYAIFRNYYHWPEPRRIYEIIPAVLHVSQESRAVALRKYGTVAPEDLRGFGWLLVQPMMRTLLTLTTMLGLPTLDTQFNNTQMALKRYHLKRAIIAYVNTKCASLYNQSLRPYPRKKVKERALVSHDPKLAAAAFACLNGEYKDHWSPPPFPLWLNSDHDIVVLVSPYDPASQQVDSKFLDRYIFGPDKLKPRVVRHLALVRPTCHGSLFFSVRDFTDSMSQTWRSQFSANDFTAESSTTTGLLSITLLLPKIGEVIVVTLDDSYDIQPLDSWIYSLDTTSTTFRRMMGGDWTGITWRVTLPRRVGMESLWTALKWWDHRRENWELMKAKIIRSLKKQQLGGCNREKWLASFRARDNPESRESWNALVDTTELEEVGEGRWKWVEQVL